jgi:L,D-transpeptidase catalytic domain/Bacterial Ig-like domain
VALVDEGSNEDAVEADAEVKVTAGTEAIPVEEHDEVGASAEAEAQGADSAGPVDEEEPGDEAALDHDPAEAADTNETPETVAAAVTQAEPAADSIAAAVPVAASGTGAVQPVALDEDPAPTVADKLPGPLAGAAAAAAGAADGGAADGGAAGAGITTAGGVTGSGNWIRRLMGGARRASGKARLSRKIVIAAGAAAALVIALVIIAANSSGSGNMSTAANHKASHKQAAPVSVVSASPGNGETGVNGTAPITVTYSGPITKSTPLPTLSPSIAGSWQTSGDRATFTPQVGFTEDTHVTVTIPAPAGTTTAAATSFSFTTGHYSVLRLDELLSQLGYIPVTWTPTDPSGNIPATDASGQLAAAYDPPGGTFNFEPGYPSALTSQWSVGTDNEIIDGAVRTFEFDQNLAMDGDAGPRVWSHLLMAVARGERNRHGYTYVWVTQAGSEHLDLYHDGRLAITSPVNTGIAASPTDDGTFPVYLRYTVTQMVGTNPDGSPYDDTVYWVSYFNGGDAVHAFPRASYGWYQSLGCVELPTYGSTAEDVWNLITYGTLVTVTGPVA